MAGYRCERCEHQWVPRQKDDQPTVCPRCKSRPGTGRVAPGARRRERRDLLRHRSRLGLESESEFCIERLDLGGAQDE